MEGETIIYQFVYVQVDLKSFRLFKTGTAVELEPKAFEVLVYLIENCDRLIEKKELLDAVWKDAFVTENAMTLVIAQLRKALGDDSKKRVSHRGVEQGLYCFRSCLLSLPRPRHGTRTTEPN